MSPLLVECIVFWYRLSLYRELDPQHLTSLLFQSLQEMNIWGFFSLFPDFSQFATAAAAAKSLQSCPMLCDPIDGSPPGSPSLGFSRQEHWSGLPFPSPMHESEKWKWSRSVAICDYVSLILCGLRTLNFLKLSHPTANKTHLKLVRDIYKGTWAAFCNQWWETK